MLPSTPFILIPYATAQEPHPITLSTSSTWSHAGLPLDPSALPAHFHHWQDKVVSSGELAARLIPLLRFLNEYLENETEMTHYTLTIRAQKATEEYDVPRWHFDRGAFDQDVGFTSPKPAVKEKRWGLGRKKNMGGERKLSSWKIASALWGPGTLFLKDSAKGRELMDDIQTKLKNKRKEEEDGEEHSCYPLRCVGCAETASAVRCKLAEDVGGLGMEVIHMQPGEVAVFKAESRGDWGNGNGRVPAMHSEPRIDGDRVFVHVVPGTEEEVRGLVVGWGMSFPRCWSVGVAEDWNEKVQSTND